MHPPSIWRAIDSHDALAAADDLRVGNVQHSMQDRQQMRWSSSVASTIMPIRMAGSFARKTAIVGTIVHSDYCTACGMIGHRASECTTFAPNSRLEKLVNEVLEGTTLDWEVCARTH